MPCLRSVLLLISLTAQAQTWAVSPSWIGLWRENSAKSSIFIPGTLSVNVQSSGAYVLIGVGGQRTPLECVPNPLSRRSCLYLTSPRQTGKGDRKTGAEYKVNARGKELEVDHWRIVPDGSRLTDTDYYTRSSAGTGFAGRWRKTRSIEAPTVYRISIDEDRMTIAVPNGELNVSFSIMQARTPRGAYVSLGFERGNIYKLLGPSKLLEQSVARGKVVARSVIVLSPDEQTMTENHVDAGRSLNPLHIVYERSR